MGLTHSAPVLSANKPEIEVNNIENIKQLFNSAPRKSDSILETLNLSDFKKSEKKTNITNVRWQKK